MELQLVTFEQAKVLKELGFPQERIVECYNSIGELYMSRPDNEEYLDAPTLELVAKWLRDEKNYHIMIGTYDSRIVGESEESYMYVLYHIKPIKSLGSNSTIYNSYEEALSAGIDKAIETLKNKDI